MDAIITRPPPASATSAADPDSGSSGSGSASGLASGSTYDDLYNALAARAQNENGEREANDEYCMFNETETTDTHCMKPRSCGACLRVAGCMVNSTGSCVSNALHYNQSLDFRVATLYKNTTLSLRTSYDFWNTSGASTIQQDQIQRWIFPSTTVEYCAPTDQTCTLCRDSIFQDAVDMRYCVGVSGCVCTALCESPELEAIRSQATVCVATAAPKKPLPQPVMWIVGAGIALAVCGLWYWWVWRRTSDKHGKSEVDDATNDAIRCMLFKDRCDKSVAGGPGSGTSLPSVYQAPQLDMPIMELSVNEFPRYSIDTSSRRRPGGPGDE